MAYEKQNWVDGDPSTPLSAERLNHIENGIAAVEGTAGPAGPKGDRGPAGAKGADASITPATAVEDATGAEDAHTQLNKLLSALREAGFLATG